MGDFAKAVGDFADVAEDMLLAVFQQSVILLAREMTKTEGEGGALPKLTGNLLRSILAQLGSMPGTGDAEQIYGGSDVGAVVAMAMLDSDIYVGFQANYARRMNYGFVGQDSLGRTYNQAGRHFVERAVAMWPQLVKQAVQDVKGGVGV